MAEYWQCKGNGYWLRDFPGSHAGEGSHPQIVTVRGLNPAISSNWVHTDPFYLGKSNTPHIDEERQHKLNG